jgi:simple sugar transport system substrate-binding protein
MPLLNKSVRNLSVLVASAWLAATQPVAAEDKKLEITMIFQTEEGFGFFNPVKKGAEEAAAMGGAHVTFQYANGSVDRYKSLVAKAATAKADGVALTIIDDRAYRDEVCALTKAGIPVVAYNVDDSKGAKGSCRMAFIGQDFVATGYLIGKRMIAEADIKSGDLVLTPVDSPDAVYAILRQRGVDKAMKEVGAHTEILGAGFKDAEILAAQVKYLTAHPNVKAIIGIGLPQVEMALKATEAVKRSIPIGGFDLSQNVIDAIKAGKVVATVDQQPYTQGFYSVMQLIHKVRYGLYPSDMKTGGDGLVDKTNYKQSEAELGKRR